MNMMLILKRGLTSSSNSRIIPRSRVFVNSSQRGRLRRDPPVRRPSESASASLDAWDAAVDILKRGKANNQGISFTGGLRIALLIDAENITYKNVDGIMNEVEKLGIVQIRRIYADWTSEIMRGWRQTVLTNALTPVHQFQSSTGKGNTDSMMIIDAMDIMHKNKDIESFCIVSSDADFTRLATKLREEGKLVLGIGSNLTPAPFVVACNRFVYLHNLIKEDPSQAPVPSSKLNVSPSTSPSSSILSGSVKAPGPSKSAVALVMASGTSTTAPPAIVHQQQQQQLQPVSQVTSSVALRTKAKIDMTNWDSKPSSATGSRSGATAAASSGMEAFKGVLPLLTRAWASYRLDNGWAPLAGVMAEVQRLQPEFEPTTYGPFAKLEDLLEATDVFEVRKSKSASATSLVRRVMASKSGAPVKQAQPAAATATAPEQ